MRNSCGRLRCVIAVVAIGGTTAATATAARPTVKECTQLELASFGGNRLAATVVCLRPTSLRTTASVKWTTCPTTPKEDVCAEGAIELTFRSTGTGFGPARAPDSWGRERIPGGAIYSLPGIGRYTCEAHSVDRTNGLRRYAVHTKMVAVRDQAVGFAARGKGIVVASSVHPGRRGPLDVNADAKLGRSSTCRVGVPIGVEFVRSLWPGASFPPGTFAGTATRLSSSGTVTRAITGPDSEGLPPGVELQARVRWSSTVVVVPALWRR